MLCKFAKSRPCKCVLRKRNVYNMHREEVEKKARKKLYIWNEYFTEVAARAFRNQSESDAVGRADIGRCRFKQRIR